MLAGSGLSSYATAVESIHAQVIDADLRATMSEASPGEKLSVEVTLPDLDASDLEDQIDLEEAVQLIERGEECPPIYNLRQMLSSSDLELDGDTVQELIMVQRRSYAELYEEWNGRFAEDNLDGLEVSYVSHYFPIIWYMIIMLSL
ncbi:MAG: hypothetical protein ACI3XR_03345 [Eubacteriales bacterium]